MDGVYRIGPPPEPDDYNRGALEEDGRRIYLCSLGGYVPYRLETLYEESNYTCVCRPSLLLSLIVVL